MANIDKPKTLARKVLAAAAVIAAFALGAQPAAAAGQPSLVGQWRFDESAGQSALDDGPFGLDGRLGSFDVADPSDPVRIRGVASGALRFTGSSFIRLPDASELAVPTLTVEAVVRAAGSPGQWRYVVSHGSQECIAGSYGLYTGAAGGMAFYVFDGSRYVVSATARPADVWNDRWHHVAGTFDGRSLRLFVDGRPVGQAAAAQLRIDYATTSAATYFGKYVGDCDLPFRGDLDLVRMWSGALPADAVATEARRAVGSSTPVPAAPRPLPPAAGATVIPAPRKGRPATTGSTAGSPPRACVVRLSRKRVAFKRRTVVRVRVARRRHPLRGVRVVARRSGHRKVLAKASTGARGRARLTLKVKRTGRVRVSAKRRDCSAAYLKVVRRLSRRA